jgi:hypothetical protein
VVENKVLGRIFGPKREEVKEGRESCILRIFIIYTLLQIFVIRVIKSRRMRWAGHIACMTY